MEYRIDKKWKCSWCKYPATFIMCIIEFWNIIVLLCSSLNPRACLLIISEKEHAQIYKNIYPTNIKNMFSYSSTNLMPLVFPSVPLFDDNSGITRRKRKHSTTFEAPALLISSSWLTRSDIIDALMELIHRHFTNHSWNEEKIKYNPLHYLCSRFDEFLHYFQVVNDKRDHF